MFSRPRSAVLLFGGFLVLVVAAALLFYFRPRVSEPNGVDEDDRLFRESAEESGITFRMAFLPDEQGLNFKTNLYDHGCGVAVGDFDGDGHDDVYFCNQLGSNALYRNKGDGTFEDVTDKAGVGLGDRVCVGATFADTRNNGLQDLFVTSTRGGNVLFRNRGNGTFENVTREAGVEHIGHSQTAVFFDYDNDGYLDLFVTNTAKWTQGDKDPSQHYYPGISDLAELVKSPREFNILYHNNGDGTFTNVTEKAGLKGAGWGGDVAVLDYDEDGYQDLLVTDMFGRSHLYHNNGNGTFTEVTGKTLKRTSMGAIGAKAFDFNNDGKLDLMLADMHSDMWMPANYSWKMQEMLRQVEHRQFRSVLGPLIEMGIRGPEAEKYYNDVFHIRPDEVIFGNTLFKNLGAGQFKEVSSEAGVETWWPWGIATGDFDNDGFEDVFLPSGMGYPYIYWPNRLLMNNGNETFSERSEQTGIEPPRGGKYMKDPLGGVLPSRSSRCAAVADFDGDGRLEIVTSNFNDTPYYFRNHFPRKHWVAFRLHGTHCNRDAIGAVVRIYRGSQILTRQVNPAGGYLSQSSKTVHFGLGDSADIDRVEVHWPGSPAHAGGWVQKIKKPAIDQLHALVEP
jgi:hypothetical protein